MRLPRLAAAVVALLILGCGTSVRPGRSGAHKPARVAPLGPSVSRSPRRSTVVDPHQAARAVATLFRLREDALAREDIAGVRRVETGAAEERDVGLIEDARGIRERLLNTHRSLGAVQVLVPRQTTYPARALGVLEIRSPFPTAAGLYVATRAGPRAPWKLAVVVETIKSSLLLLVQRAVNRRSGYEVTGHKPWISPGAVYGLLASYMQYWKQHDSPPPQTPFAPGPATTGEGSASGATRQDAVSNQGVRQHISNFAAPRHDGAYLFPVTPTVSLICGAVRERERAADSLDPRSRLDPVADVHRAQEVDRETDGRAITAILGVGLDRPPECEVRERREHAALDGAAVVEMPLLRAQAEDEL